MTKYIKYDNIKLSMTTKLFICYENLTGNSSDKVICLLNETRKGENGRQLKWKFLSLQCLFNNKTILKYLRSKLFSLIFFWHNHQLFSFPKNNKTCWKINLKIKTNNCL